MRLDIYGAFGDFTKSLILDPNFSEVLKERGSLKQRIASFGPQNTCDI